MCSGHGQSLNIVFVEATHAHGLLAMAKGVETHPAAVG